MNWYLSELQDGDCIRMRCRNMSARKIMIYLSCNQAATGYLVRRSISREEITGILKRFGELQPGLRLQTNFYRGFPSETEEDVAASISAAESVNSIRLSFMHIMTRIIRFLPGWKVKYPRRRSSKG